MTPSFPFCKSVGLRPDRVIIQDSDDDDNLVALTVVYAEDLEALLAKGVRVSWDKLDGWIEPLRSDGRTCVGHEPNGADTHQALLIDIRPIKREPRRALLSEDEVREIVGDRIALDKISMEGIIHDLFGPASAGKQGGE